MSDYELRQLNRQVEKLCDAIDKLTPFLEKLAKTPVATQQQDFDTIEAQKPPVKRPLCVHQVDATHADGILRAGTGPCDLTENMDCRNRIDTHKRNMRGLTGREDWENSVGWMSAEQSEERARVRKWLDEGIGDPGDGVGCGGGFADGSNSHLTIDGHRFSRSEFRKWQTESAYNLLRASLWAPDVAARCHLTPAEVQKIQKEYQL
jgi:hypothetical protein